MNADTATGYLAAMIDGEGTVHHVGRRQRYVVIYNTEIDILDATELACQVLGIECRRKEHKNNNAPKRQCYGIYIFGRENLQKVYDAMPANTRKKLKLAGLLNSYLPRNE